MFSRRCDIVIPGPQVEEVKIRSAPYAVKRGQSPLWIRIRDDRRGRPRIAARMTTQIVHSYGGSYVPNGTLRGRIEPVSTGELDAESSGVRVVGRVRWGFASYVVWIMLALAVAIGAMVVAYDNNVIGWFILVPLGIAAVHLFLLLPMLGSDPRLIAEELRVVFQGETEARELGQLREFTEQYLPGVDFPPPDSGPADQDRR